MSAFKFNKVYVISDVEDCVICREFGEEFELQDDPAALMDSLLKKEADVALFIDVRYYIKLGAEARNRLMAVARDVPCFRIRYDHGAGGFKCIDNPRQYCPREREESPRLRMQERVQVQLNAELTKEDDPFVQHGLRTSVLNISSGGCFVYCVDNAPYVGFAYVRIQELSNKRPIYCSIRWRREWGISDSLPGLGVQFVDIQPDQVRELQDMYITPYLLSLDE